MAYSGAVICRRSQPQKRQRGDCSQPCRWEYLFHESQDKRSLILQEDERYSYLLSSKDLCLIEHLPEVLASGATSLKIEGGWNRLLLAVVTAHTGRLLILWCGKKKIQMQSGMDRWTYKNIQSRLHHRICFCEENNELIRTLIYPDSRTCWHSLEYDAANKRMLIGVRNHIRAVVKWNYYCLMIQSK